MQNSPVLSSFFMPFTAQRQFKADPRLVVAAKGMYYTSHDDRQILDGSAGLWAVATGHGRQEIADAVYKQMQTLDFGHNLQMGHPIAFEFASRLAKIAPKGFGHVFFTNSGSESVDTALKMALAYHHAKGEKGRVKLIGRERAYHGVNFGGISVGGMVNNRRVFQTLPNVDHLPHTHGIKENLFSKGQPEHGAYLARELDRIAALHGPETIAAVIVEPVAGSTGVLVPPKGYLEELRAACDRIGCLLIFDEVITGFGRIGAPFASQYFNIMPDIFTTAKAINNAAIPMGAVFASDKVHNAFEQGPEHLIDFFHGYTCSGHPAACAAGIANLDIMEREGLFYRAAELAKVWEEAAHSLRDFPFVIDIRNFGLIAAIELSPIDGAIGTRGYNAFVECYKNGLLTRVTGDTIALSPPLIINESEIHQIFEIIGKSLHNIS